VPSQKKPPAIAPGHAAAAASRTRATAPSPAKAIAITPSHAASCIRTPQYRTRNGIFKKATASHRNSIIVAGHAAAATSRAALPSQKKPPAIAPGHAAAAASRHRATAPSPTKAIAIAPGHAASRIRTPASSPKTATAIVNGRAAAAASRAHALSPKRVGCVSRCARGAARLQRGIFKKANARNSINRAKQCSHGRRRTRCPICIRKSKSGTGSLCEHLRQKGWCLECQKNGKEYYGEGRKNGSKKV
jgi:hypothetical protein